MSVNVQQLAKQFIDATVNKWGTEESEVDQILKTVHDSNTQTQFEASVASSLNEEQAKQFVKKEGGLGRDRGTISAILHSEMEGSELVRALDLYRHGSETYRASYDEYYVEGLKHSVDLSSTTSKVVVGGATVVIGGLAIVYAPAALIIGGAALVGTAAYGLGKTAVEAVQVLTADTEEEAKQNMIELGEGVGILAMSAPFAPKGAQAAKGAATAIRAGRAGRAVRSAEATAITEHVAAAKAAATKSIGPGTKEELAAIAKEVDGTIKPTIEAIKNGEIPETLFQIKDPAAFLEFTKNLTGDLYGDSTLTIAIRWARTMEVAVERGYALDGELIRLAEIAADYEGMSGGGHYLVSKYLQNVWQQGDYFTKLSKAWLPVVN